MSAPSAPGTFGRNDSRARGRKTERKYLVAGIAVALAALLISLLWVWNQGAEARAIRHLPPLERRALYERTLKTLTSPCDPQARSDGLREFCRDQAQFVTEFPECDEACLALARRYSTAPSK